MEKQITFGETTLIVTGTQNKSHESTSTPGVDEFEPESFWRTCKMCQRDDDFTQDFCNIIDAINEHYTINVWEMIDEKLNQ